MHQILVYADSLTWGIVPGTRCRLSFDRRWPGVMEGSLRQTGMSVRVIEDCLNGRRTAFDDPYKPGRNGLAGIEQRIEINSPLSLVIVMLGTNDFQSMHPHNAWHSAQGIGALIDAIRRAPLEPEIPTPQILVVAPPLIVSPKGPIAPKFEGAAAKCRGLAEEFSRVAIDQGCSFFDASTVTKCSRIDGVHLDEDQHADLGKALAGVVARLIDPEIPKID